MGTKELELTGVLAQTLSAKFEEGVEALKDISVTDEKFAVTLGNTMNALQLSEKFRDMFIQLYNAEAQKAEANSTTGEGSAD